MANWIAGAIRHPGALTQKTKAAGMSVSRFSKQVSKPGSKASATTKRQVNLAKTLKKLGK